MDGWRAANSIHGTNPNRPPYVVAVVVIVYYLSIANSMKIIYWPQHHRLQCAAPFHRLRDYDDDDDDCNYATPDGQFTGSFVKPRCVLNIAFCFPAAAGVHRLLASRWWSILMIYVRAFSTQVGKCLMRSSNRELEIVTFCGAAGNKPDVDRLS